MGFSTFSENKIVAALLTVALAQSQSRASSGEILGDYRKFLSELSPKQPATPLELDNQEGNFGEGKTDCFASGRVPTTEQSERREDERDNSRSDGFGFYNFGLRRVHHSRTAR